MKFTYLLLIALVATLFVACKQDPKGTTNNGNAATTAPAATNVVYHYICQNNCAGSGAMEAGTCPTCGVNYVHNAAFHAQEGTGSNPSLNTLQGPQNPQFQQNPAATQTPQTPQAPEPAQNAAGVYHYTCSKGCSGGSGTGGVCATCGGPLSHNQAYHQ